MRPYNSGACVNAAVAHKLSVYVRRILRRPEVRVMSALILVISGNVGLKEAKREGGGGRGSRKREREREG